MRRRTWLPAASEQTRNCNCIIMPFMWAPEKGSATKSICSTPVCLSNRRVHNTRIYYTMHQDDERTYISRIIFRVYSDAFRPLRSFRRIVFRRTDIIKPYQATKEKKMNQRMDHACRGSITNICIEWRIQVQKVILQLTRDQSMLAALLGAKQNYGVLFGHRTERFAISKLGYFCMLQTIARGKWRTSVHRRTSCVLLCLRSAMAEKFFTKKTILF